MTDAEDRTDLPAGDAVASTWSVTITLDRSDARTSRSSRRVSLDNKGIKVGDITLKWRIGQGGFGIVFAGTRGDGTILAVKLTQRMALDPAASPLTTGTNPYFSGTGLYPTDRDASEEVRCSNGGQSFKASAAFLSCL